MAKARSCDGAIALRKELFRVLRSDLPQNRPSIVADARSPRLTLRGFWKNFKQQKDYID
jgi:hypothetical protein